MRSVHKYPIPLNDYFSMSMPKGAVILDVKDQRGAPQMWALVDTDPELVKEERHFRLVGTGHLIEDGNLVHIASFLMHDGALVFHVFEL